MMEHPLLFGDVLALAQKAAEEADSLCSNVYQRELKTDEVGSVENGEDESTPPTVIDSDSEDEENSLHVLEEIVYNKAKATKKDCEGTVLDTFKDNVMDQFQEWFENTEKVVKKVIEKRENKQNRCRRE